MDVHQTIDRGKRKVEEETTPKSKEYAFLLFFFLYLFSILNIFFILNHFYTFLLHMCLFWWKMGTGKEMSWWCQLPRIKLCFNFKKHPQKWVAKDQDLFEQFFLSPCFISFLNSLNWTWQAMLLSGPCYLIFYYSLCSRNFNNLYHCYAF